MNDGRARDTPLAGEAIPLESHIVAVADGFDAMTSDRPYQKAIPTSEVVEEIKRFAGSQFGTDLVSRFVQAADQLKL